MRDDYLIRQKPMHALLVFAAPIILGNLFQQTYTMVDSAMVGRFVSEQALAAVGASYSLTNIFICVAIGGGIGASVTVSRYFGAGKLGEMKTAVYTALLVFLGIGLSLGLVGLVLGRQIMVLLNTPGDVLDMAAAYLRIYFAGLPFLFMYNILSSMFNALGKSRIPLGFLIFSSLFNIGLDWYFVTRLSMGVTGVAWATLIAQGISAMLSFGVLLGLLRGIIRAYIEIFRGTPMILQAVFIYYGLPYFTNNAVQFRNIWAVSILVVSINTGAYMAESVRGGILSVDRGQTEGAKAIGMTHVQTMLSVVLPQALRNIMPQIGNNFIINVKDTSVMFIIGFNDFFAVHKAVAGATFRFFPSAAIEMAGYLTMTLLASFLLRRLEKLLDGHASYELVREDPLVATAGTYNYPGKGSPYDERTPEGRNHPEQALKNRSFSAGEER